MEDKKGLILEGTNPYLHHSGGQRMGISLPFTKKKSFGFCASNTEKWPSHYQMGNTNAQPVQGMVNNEHETHDHMKHCLDSRLSLLGITFHQNQSSMGLKNHAMSV